MSAIEKNFQHPDVDDVQSMLLVVLHRGINFALASGIIGCFSHLVDDHLIHSGIGLRPRPFQRRDSGFEAL